MPKATPYATVADEPTGPVVGHVVMTVTRKEAKPIYGIEGGHITYGAVVDEHIRDFYLNDPDGDLQDVSLELSPDAQRILRESVRNGSYR